MSIAQLDKVMQNAGLPHFDFEMFKAAYDSMPDVQNLVKNFDQDKIEIAIDAVDNLSTPSADGSDDVEKMAKRATDL
jgi:hypothetical protein